MNVGLIRPPQYPSIYWVICVQLRRRAATSAAVVIAFVKIKADAAAIWPRSRRRHHDSLWNIDYLLGLVICLSMYTKFTQARKPVPNHSGLSLH